MLPYDLWPEPVDGAFSSAAVQRYLDAADVARQRLEAELDIAHQRRRLLQAELAEVIERTAGLTRELFDTTREIRSDRHSRTNEVAVILAAAEAQAAAIVARARQDAAALRRATTEAATDARTPLALVPHPGVAHATTEPPLLVG